MTVVDPAAAMDYMRLLVDRVPSMLAYWDRDLTCRFANRAYEAWFGVNPDDLLGTSIRDLLGPELFAMNEPLMRKALMGEHQVFERIVPGPGGIQRHSLAEYIPDQVDGVVRGFLVQVTNVTELQVTRAALLRESQLRSQLEAHAKELQVLLHERTDMLNVLAHEVRQPLNNASAALQSAATALSGLDEKAASARLARAQGVMAQVMGSIDNTLAVASLLALPGPVHREDADINMLLALVIAELPDDQRERVKVERATETRTAAMDIGLMRLAVRNLLNNALIHSAPEAPVTIHLSDSDEPLALVIDVIDQGSGIPDELLPHLFERRLSATPQRRAHGLGLGLYIVGRVMALHGGSVSLSRNTPQGVTMRLVVNQGLSD